ncbi:MAG: AI-2E family transporter [Eubacterium sp.]|nr:AI-2E family transporter [Eubacterium sp.]
MTNQNNDSKEKRKQFWKERPHLAWGLTFFIVAVLIICVFFAFYRYQGLASGWSTVMMAFQPILIGFVVAYLMNPIERRIEKKMLKNRLKKAKDELKVRRSARNAATGISILIFCGIVVALIMLIVPQTIMSIQQLMVSLPDDLRSFQSWVNEMSAQNDKVEAVINQLNSIAGQEEDGHFSMQAIIDWVANEFLPASQNLIESISTGVFKAAKTVVNFVIGIIIAIYVLATKDKLKAQAKKLIYSIFQPVRANWLVNTIRQSDRIFGGFIIGKIIDSFIIGVICYVAMQIIDLPYPALVSVIIGVTNVVPFFGPFIGAIPCVMLIFLINPLQALFFLILVLCLQTFDGYILSPKILGDTTGLNTFWVLFAILTFGGIFGVPGMVLGVPVFGVIYYVVKDFMRMSLTKKKLPVEENAYRDLQEVDPKTKAVSYHSPENDQGRHKKRDNYILKRKKNN